ncbi:hypothetical protein E2C01_058689 [Portunus trituberculatus]|uniref:Uncharacterized protein n=1 Tax=Portunus trituberculatus TaxID=210409 RepID=A0A5B7GW84_PORTR|nr:hypothetical protein [Portunus trituberculatus]
MVPLYHVKPVKQRGVLTPSYDSGEYWTLQQVQMLSGGKTPAVTPGKCVCHAPTVLLYSLIAVKEH